MWFSQHSSLFSSIATKYRFEGLWILTGFGLLAGFLLLGNIPPIADEGFHCYQIQLFLHGNYSISPALTVPPVYHAIIAAIFKLVGIDALIVARLISFTGSLFCIYIFYLLAKHISPENCQIRTLQFIFSPIVFPFLFLIYTDIFALAAVLLSFERGISQKPWQSAAALALAVAMRPPNIIWGLFAFAILVGLHLSPTHFHRNLISRYCTIAIPFALLLGAFFLFAYLNHGISVGDRKHQHIAFNISNVWFYLLVFFTLFWPNCLESSRAFLAPVIRKSRYWATGSSLAFCCYLFTYHISHQYNRPSLWFYLRNRILYFTTTFPAIKVLSFLPITLGSIGFSPLSFSNRTVGKVLVPLTFLSILPFPVIEQRYYLVPLALFQLFRKDTNHEETITLIYLACSAFLTIGISQHSFFL
jgi:alpha-1,2-glucosyltransferase